MSIQEKFPLEEEFRDNPDYKPEPGKECCSWLCILPGMCCPQCEKEYDDI